MTALRISRIVEKTKVEGPGLRYAIWVQGCPIRCEGCFNPHTWEMDGGKIREIDEIVSDIQIVRNASPELEGVTFLGGEPFSQAYELSVLARKVKEMNLSVVTFSGYDYDTIRRSGHRGWQQLLKETDLLIDGPYIQSQHDLSRPWIGSRNQQYRFLTDRYKELEARLPNIANKIEIRLHADGTITANGMAQLENLELLLGLGYERKEVKE
ncbi:MAG: 4Fe-4S single cluster domain-containing protein [Paenibacillus macerans]|uniref:4Fe-4S cluster-binding domain-containing protein n=1 Tax=Paenibacillus macerans TaxID=44252 RepID=A0A090ZFU7_PAEMA|nr:4Fe-4S single cluster domain-containing protein [Paenibacillus macerans]KFN10199.1 radical SAM superfamily protein [Paenibacillus macerans]MCY7561515.1 radical SAM protein [Paenibacillus macerans]MDU7476938.1 4Fe-4S single cluster domain-containing protein [Paenibacillus macerans]MEC0152970.1 4Fe-4S single cluster domain-containing protein [Paenibacillus macerans]MUG25493.1 4Fe-4S cluster-binding domain-containing protein [Paenibacillus macerans]